MPASFTNHDLLNLTEDQAREICQQGTETIVCALPQLAALAKGKVAAEVSRLSSQVAPHEKPAGKNRPKKRGRKKGHKGVRRAPLEINKE